MKTTLGRITQQISRDSLHSNIFMGVSSYTSILVTWLLALSLAIPPLLGWSHYAPEISGMRYSFHLDLFVDLITDKYLLIHAIKIHFDQIIFYDKLWSCVAWSRWIILRYIHIGDRVCHSQLHYHLHINWSN